MKLSNFAGLDFQKDRVIQVAMLVTDSHLNLIPDQQLNFVIQQPAEVIGNMSDWCKENLKDIGEASLESNITEEMAEESMLEFVKRNVDGPRTAPLAGNSVHYDRLFLKRYFPKVDEYLHYRIIDVSTVKELCGRWNKKVYTSAPQKMLKHRALEDIQESINELKHYQQKFFRVDSQ